MSERAGDFSSDTKAFGKRAAASRHHRDIRGDEDPKVVELVAAAVDPKAWAGAPTEFVKRKMVSTRQAIRAIRAYRRATRRVPEGD